MVSQDRDQVDEWVVSGSDYFVTQFICQECEKLVECINQGPGEIWEYCRVKTQGTLSYMTIRG